MFSRPVAWVRVLVPILTTIRICIPPKEVVCGNRDSATYLLYFTDVNGQKISDTQKIIADKTSENTQDRTFRCNFNLRSQKYSNLETYYLIIADETGLQMPIKEEFQIDIAFAMDEFDFF